MLVFMEGGKLENPEESSQSKERTDTSPNHIWHQAGIEAGPLWWEASCLTTVQSLLPWGQWWKEVSDNNRHFKFPVLIYEVFCRLAKEKEMYKKEVKDQGAKVDKMKAENKDEYDIKKQVNISLSECIVTGVQNSFFSWFMLICVS